MSERRVLIIGASRGVGLGLAREFASREWQVHASQRSPSDALAQAAETSAGRIAIVTADVTDDASIAALGETIAAGSLDALVLNAGVYGPDDQSIMGMGREDVAEIMMTNAIGPARAALALLPLLRDGATIGMMTSKMGSIDDSSGGSNHYRISKGAQNMLARSLFQDHARERGIAVLSLHPGWVRTDMGGPNALIEVEESASGLADLLAQDRPPEHLFLAYDGSGIGW